MGGDPAGARKSVGADGRYVLIRTVGRGAMGVVFLARDTLLGRDVALKTFSFAPAAENVVFRARLLREARTAGRLSHRNIVMVHDVFEEDSAPYIAMEYVEGIDLLSFMQRHGRIEPRLAAAIVAKVAAALDYAHGKGVIHRDIKPANIILTGNLEPKITDFGIACVHQSTLTTIEHFLGTPNYMAPEQIEARPADGRADLFSLGVVLFEMLTGERPFPGTNILVVARRIVEQPAPLASALAPEVPSELDFIIDRMLAKDPDRRYARGSEVSQDLERILGGSSPTVLVDSSGDLTLPMNALERPSEVPASSTPGRLRRLVHRAIRYLTVASVTTVVGLLAAVGVQSAVLGRVVEAPPPDPKLERLRESLPHLQDGLRLYRVERYGDALVAFERALALSPERDSIRGWRRKADEQARLQREQLRTEQELAQTEARVAVDEALERANRVRAQAAVVALDITVTTEIPTGTVVVARNGAEIFRRDLDFDTGSPFLRRLPWRSRVLGEVAATRLIPPGGADFVITWTGAKGKEARSRLRAGLERGDQPVLRIQLDRRRELEVTLGYH